MAGIIIYVPHNRPGETHLLYGMKFEGMRLGTGISTLTPPPGTELAVWEAPKTHSRLFPTANTSHGPRALKTGTSLLTVHSGLIFLFAVFKKTRLD